MSWHSRAACLGADPELFFPIGETGPALSQIAEAKQVCGRCRYGSRACGGHSKASRPPASGAG